MNDTDILDRYAAGELHPTRYPAWEAYRKLVEYIEAENTVLVCVGSSMTDEVAMHLHGDRPPFPCNFRMENGAIAFDFPDTVEVDKPEGKLTLHFEKCMMGIIPAAAELYEGNLRTIHFQNISEISFRRDGTVFVAVEVDEYSREYFRFALFTREELDAAEAGDDVTE